MTDEAGYRPTDDSALRWEDCHCTKCGQPDKKCECVALTPGTKPTISSNERATFEQWAQKRGFTLESSREGIYLNTHTLDAWSAWEAAIQTTECGIRNGQYRYCDGHWRDKSNRSSSETPERRFHEGERQSYLKAVELSVASGMLGDGDKSDLLEMYQRLWPRAPSDVRANALKASE